MPAGTSEYTSHLNTRFKQYREARFADAPDLFEPRPDDAPVVFRRGYSHMNILVPPFASDEERRWVVEAIPANGRHRHFASMRSSQALAQSVFGTINALGRLPLLSGIQSEDGRPAFGPTLKSSSLSLEKSVDWLGEPRPTSIDAWINGGGYRVAVECKLAESEFGQCSRPRLTPRDAAYGRYHCDGSYARQRQRRERCALTEVGVRYWDYLDDLMGWRPDVDHVPCPLSSTYQLVRNVLAACVRDPGLDFERGHALVIYDQRNPTMSTGGHGEEQWKHATDSLRCPGALRRLSWQAFLGQCARDEVLDWLRCELAAKYGLAA